MSVLILSPTVFAALQADFCSGQWGVLTYQFMNQLLQRVGGGTAPTITEIHTIVTTAVVPDFDQTPHAEGVVSFGLAVTDVTPRQEVVLPNFDLGNLWP